MPVFFLRKLTFFLVIGDYLVINLLYFLGIYFFLDERDMHVQSTYITQFLLLNFSWYIISKFVKLYDNAYLKESPEHFSAFTKSILTYIFFVFFYINLFYSNKIGFDFSLRYLTLITLCMGLNRVVLLLLRKRYRFRMSRAVNTVLIGKNSFAKSIFSRKEIRAAMGVRGYYSFTKLNDRGKYLGDISNFMQDLEDGWIDNIILCDDSMSRHLYDRIITAAEQKMVRIYFVPGFRYINSGSNEIAVIQGFPFMKLMPEPLTNPVKQFVKRSFDIVFSLLVIVFVLSWLFPLVALIIKLESKGPVFFVQKRSGLNNKTFNCLKFRSMRVNEVADLVTATKNDARITRFGAFMRKTSIDELPQFFNVLAGQMSVVGPRPHMISQTEQYATITRKYMLRHMVKPGITGWAQVMGARGEIFSDADMQNRIEKDIWYIQHWSVFLDLKIIFLTFYNIVKGDEQAY